MMATNLQFVPARTKGQENTVLNSYPIYLDITLIDIWNEFIIDYNYNI